MVISTFSLPEKKSSECNSGGLSITNNIKFLLCTLWYQNVYYEL